MKISIDTEKQTLQLENEGEQTEMPLYSSQAFEIVSNAWVKTGWELKYSYSFSWFGRPLIQLPEDVLRIQEIIWQVQPDLIIETGIAHGGSLVFYASLCKAMDKGRVVGVDIEIRPNNRAALEEHPLASLITLIEGSSVDDAVVKQVESHVAEGDTVLVILDSCHTKDHVLAELEAYRHLVSPGSYIVATDGIMRDLHDVPHGETHWDKDNPAEAATLFAGKHSEFQLVEPAPLFNESNVESTPTYWPCAYLKRAS